MDAARALVDRRLGAKGMRATPTEALGNCFFIAVVDTCGLAITPMEARRQICDYIEKNPRFFADSFPDGEAGLQRH
eukprot:3573109-Karenia_brevis.AAC.1